MRISDWSSDVCSSDLPTTSPPTCARRCGPRRRTERGMELCVAGEPVHGGSGGRAFDPTLPLTVFLHGAGMDHTVWELPARYFAPRGRAALAAARSEERRVGKEGVSMCRSWWSPVSEKKTIQKTRRQIII